MSLAIDEFVALFPDELRDALYDWIVTAVGSDADASTLDSWMLGLDSSAFDSGIGLEMSSYLGDQGYIASDGNLGTELTNLLHKLNSVHIVVDDSAGNKPPLALPGSQLVVPTGDASYVSSGPGPDVWFLDPLKDFDVDDGMGRDTFFIPDSGGTTQISECLIFDFEGASLLARAVPEVQDEIIVGAKLSDVASMDTSTPGYLNLELDDHTAIHLMAMYSNGTPVDGAEILERTSFLAEDGPTATETTSGKPLLIVAEDVEGEALSASDNADTVFVTDNAHNGTIELGDGDDDIVIDARNGHSGDSLTILAGSGSNSAVVFTDELGRAKLQFHWDHYGPAADGANAHAGDNNILTFPNLAPDSMIYHPAGADDSTYIAEDPNTHLKALFSMQYADDGTSVVPIPAEFSVVEDAPTLTLSIF